MVQGSFEALRVGDGDNNSKDAHRRALLQVSSVYNEPMAEPDEEQAPIFGTWRRVYAAVVVYLFFLISLFYVFTVRFNRPQ